MHENDIAKMVVDVAFNIHSDLGPGLFESVYEAVLEHELVYSRRLYVRRQVAISVIWKEVKLDLGFRADFIIENKVVVELKAIEALAPVHYKQMLTYLKLTNHKLGLLINFNENLIKNGIKRIVNGL